MICRTSLFLYHAVNSISQSPVNPEALMAEPRYFRYPEKFFQYPILFNELNLRINCLLGSLFTLIKYNLVLLKQVTSLCIDRYDQRPKIL